MKLLVPVSYTHLDVYKRQGTLSIKADEIPPRIYKRGGEGKAKGGTG